MSYPVISDAQVNEAMKLEVMIPKAAAMIPPGEHAMQIVIQLFEMSGNQRTMS